MRNFVLWIVCLLFSCVHQGDPDHETKDHKVIQWLNQEYQNQIGWPNLASPDLDLIEQQKVDISMILESHPRPSKANREQWRTHNQLVAQRVNHLNEAMFKGINRASNSSSTKAHLSIDQAQKILDDARSHPIAGIAHVSSYKRGDEIGFCFGRAMWIHYLLRASSVPTSNIIKVFAIGQIFAGGKHWEFHVATGVRTTAGFVILDPTHNTPIDIETWAQATSKFAIKHPYGRLRYYAAEPRKFLAGPGRYKSKKLLDPLYGTYFRDLIEDMKVATNP